MVGNHQVGPAKSSSTSPSASTSASASADVSEMSSDEAWWWPFSRGDEVESTLLACRPLSASGTSSSDSLSRMRGLLTVGRRGDWWLFCCIDNFCLGLSIRFLGGDCKIRGAVEIGGDGGGGGGGGCSLAGADALRAGLSIGLAADDAGRALSSGSISDGSTLFIMVGKCCGGAGKSLMAILSGSF